MKKSWGIIYVMKVHCKESRRYVRISSAYIFSVSDQLRSRELGWEVVERAESSAAIVIRTQGRTEGEEDIGAFTIPSSRVLHGNQGTSYRHASITIYVDTISYLDRQAALKISQWHWGVPSCDISHISQQLINNKSSAYQSPEV